MNTNSGSRPPLSCRLARLRAALGSGPARSAHVAACPACQEHFAAAASLDAALRRDAVSTTEELSPGFERRIMQAVAASRTPEPATSRSFGWLAGAALAAAAAVAVIFTLRDPATSGSGGSVAVAPESATPTTSAHIADAGWRPTLPSAAALATENPLQNEIDDVYADARSALRFLALNFLPADTLDRATALHNDRG